MNPIYIVLIMSLCAGLAAFGMKWRAEKSDRDPENIANDQKAEEKYAAFCENGETVSVICRSYKKGEYYVLTDRRLMIDDKKGVHSIPLDMIRKIVFHKAGGGKAEQPSECMEIVVHADKKYKIYRYSGKFDQFCSRNTDRP